MVFHPGDPVYTVRGLYKWIIIDLSAIVDRENVRKIDRKLFEKHVKPIPKHLPEAPPEYPEIAYKPTRNTS